MAKTMWYSVEDAGDHRFQFDTVYAYYEPQDILGESLRWEDIDQEYAATDAAKDYHDSHDGWESRWPLEFSLFASQDGPELCRVMVEMEAVPSFSGRVVASAAQEGE